MKKSKTPPLKYICNITTDWLHHVNFKLNFPPSLPKILLDLKAPVINLRLHTIEFFVPKMRNSRKGSISCFFFWMIFWNVQSKHFKPTSNPMDESHPNLCPWIIKDQCLNWFVEQLMWRNFLNYEGREHQERCSTHGFFNSPTLPDSPLFLERPVPVGKSFS